MILIGLMLWISVRARSKLSARAEGQAGAPAAPAGEERAPAAVRPAAPVSGLKPFAAAAAVLLCAIVAGGYVAGTEEEGIHGQGRNIAGAHMACGEQFPGCLNQGAFPFGESRLSDIHLTHRVFVYSATLAILLLLTVALLRGSRSRLLIGRRAPRLPGATRGAQRLARGARGADSGAPDRRDAALEHRC